MLTELSMSEIEKILFDHRIGRIGCADKESVHIIPVNYHYKTGYVQCYSLVGEKIQMMRQFPNVCFEVESVGDNNYWTTVICWGRYEEINDEAELQLLRPQYNELLLRMRAGLSAPPPGEEVKQKTTEADLAEPVIYRIRFNKYSGRSAKVL